MPSKPTKSRRRSVRQQRARAQGPWWSRMASAVFSWPVAATIVFVAAASAIALLGEETLRLSVGERLEQPIYAKVDFQKLDAKQTEEARRAARAQTPSYYTFNLAAPPKERVRGDLMRLYQAAVGAETFEAFQEAMKAQNWPAEESAYTSLHGMAGEQGRSRFEDYVERTPFETEYVASDWLAETREPPNDAGFIRLVKSSEEGETHIDVPHADLVSQASKKLLERSAAQLAKRFPYELRPTVEAVLLQTLREQPTIVYDQKRTMDAMAQAERATAEVYTTYRKGVPYIDPLTTEDGRLTLAQYELARLHRTAYLAFLSSPEASTERHARLLQRAGIVVCVALLSIALFVYTRMHRPKLLQSPSRTLAFGVLMLGMLLVSRLLDLKWPQIPPLVLAPVLAAGSVLAIVHPRRFALGVMCIAATLVTATLRSDFACLFTLLVGLAITVCLLEEVRTRTKIISSGVLTAVGVAIATAAGALIERQALDFVVWHAAAAAGSALLAAFFVSGALPFIERVFRFATALTLLEWRDSRNPLLQLLAREAPGTYNHSLVLANLTESACEVIGANGLLAQVGALYHDIGKAYKADYFTENQEGRISRHENLAPTMSLLIILAHVKDGIEMAKEYKLPRVLHHFIDEHHGTTVVRYFHHAASEKQPQIASGKHDREVPEAEFRYSGPKPSTLESAVLMMADGVEGAVRSLPEPTPGRIESVVHQVVMDRLNDGQFDECDITLRQIRLVEDSLAKSLCSIYHGRVAYPKAQKPGEVPKEPEDEEDNRVPRKARPIAG
ncbi:MAG: HDIG domain-containing protein [Phycisphaerales bacterium]|nr:MAG: HDIG domain-containing protein [Phycisphaerales bacterium]